jgi:hypothetical protein
MVKAYGRSLFSRRHWREIQKRHSELLHADTARLKDLESKSEQEENKLRGMLWDDFVANRWDSFLHRGRAARPLTPINKVSNLNLRKHLEEIDWWGVRNGLLDELKQGRSLLKGEALAILERLRDNRETYYGRLQEIEKRAENIVREALGVPLIGQGWVSETELFNLVQDAVAPLAVAQHARLPWLGMQHLDIYVPDLGLAIEYMGEQHFQAIEFFGGEEMLQRRKQLDRKKAELCRVNGVTLLYVTPDDEVAVNMVEKMLKRARTRRNRHALNST